MDALRIHHQPWCLVLLIFISLHTLPAHAEKPIFSDASQRLMAVMLDEGDVFSEAMPVYPHGELWFVPLGDFSRSLGLAVETHPAIAKANGFVIDQQNNFSLDVNTCTAEHDGRIEKINCDQILVYDDDIYISTALIERIYPIRIQVDSYKSQLIITAIKKLPSQERKYRNRQTGNLKSGRENAPNYPQVDIEHRNLDGLVIDQQISLNAERKDSQTTGNMKYSTLATGEILSMTSSLYLSGDEEKNSNNRFNMSRYEKKGTLLGPMKAKEIQLFDYNLPSVPLIGSGGQVKGLLISSYDRQGELEFGIRDFTDNLPDGWEVELYQNDILVDRQFSQNGKYEFKGVPLEYGTNRFRLAFYGPQGERRESFEVYEISPDLLKAGQQNYRVAYGQSLTKQPKFLVQLNRSILSNVTLQAGYFDNPTPVKLIDRYSYLGAKTYFKNLFLSSTLSYSDLSAGTAFENSLKAPAVGATLGLTHTKLNKFESATLPMVNGQYVSEIRKASTAFNIPIASGLRFTVEAAQSILENAEENLTFTKRISTKIWRLHVFNSLQYDKISETLVGEFSTMTQLFDTEIRQIINYDEKELNGFTIELNKKFSQDLSLSGGMQSLWKKDFNRLYTSLNHKFSFATLSATASYENTGNLSMGMVFSFSLDREPQSGQWTTTPIAQSETGIASIFVYLDVNQNGKFDSGDMPMPQISVLVNQQESTARTDEKGRVTIRNLTTYQPTFISVSLRTLHDPYQKPDPVGIKIIPRPGIFSLLEIPIIIASEVSGLVKIVNRSGAPVKARKGLPVILLDKDNKTVKSTMTERDGYYVITDLRLGQYTLTFDKDKLHEMKLHLDSPAATVNVGPEGIQDNIFDFVLNEIN